MTDAPAAHSQDEVIAFLAEPASHGAGDVTRMDTHCSIVFLVGDLAYKLKRAIRYSSLDYTTRAGRQAACEAELVLNRRTAPDLYLAVRSINRDSTGALVFDGAGPAIDHVVMMRRFAQADLFDALIAADRLTQGQMRELGETIARLHLAAKGTRAFGGADAIRRVIDDNDRELALVATALDGAAVGLLSARATDALGQLSDLLERRRAAGKVRRCHGDLRLANICLWAGHPTPFDCIEFSDEIGCIDVLYDLAFLLMDLHARGRGDLGNMVFNAWLDVMHETDGLRTIPLFLALRAGTRSYALAGSASRQIDADEAACRLAQARRHIQIGNEFLSPARPCLVAVGGQTGRADVALKLAAAIGPPPGARLLHPDAAGETAWEEAEAVLAAGCSVLLEGAFPITEQQRRVTELATRLGVAWFGFILDTAPRGPAAENWRVVDPDRRSLAALMRVVSGGLDADQCVPSRDDV